MQKNTSALMPTVPAVADGRTTLLMTGFGPFPGVPVNATMALVPRLAAAAKQLFPALRIVAEILPTEWIAAPQRVDHLLASHRPDIVLHFGVSSRARGFEIEARGRNARVMAPDAAGVHPSQREIRDDAQPLLPSRLPVDEIVRRLRQQGVPAFRSWSAGTYLCNATLFHVLAEAERDVAHAGFVHIPESLAGALGGHRLRIRPGCPMTWAQALIGGIEVVATLLDQPPPHPARRAAALQRHL